MRHAYRAAAVVAWLALTLGGCAAISGLSDITEQECAPTCDGGTTPDATMINPGDSAPRPGDDAPASQDTSSPPPANDATANDSPTTMQEPETGSDAPVNDAPATTDAPVSTTTCGGNTCASSADAGCCGSDCPIAHNYDEDLSSGTTFYACVAVGTYNATLAMDACAAFTGDRTQCNNAPAGEVASFTCSAEDGGPAGDMVCSNGPKASICDCWGYDGEIVGLTSTGTGTGNNACLCPAPTGATKWD